MEVKTYIKNVKISPKKLRFLLPEIKNLDPVKALDYLLYSNKKGAKIFYKAIKSAVNNIKQKVGVNLNNLRFKILTVEQGRVLKRYKAGSKGMAKPIRKRYSHIKIVLESVEEGKETNKINNGKKIPKSQKDISLKLKENNILKDKKLKIKKTKVRKLETK